MQDVPARTARGRSAAVIAVTVALVVVVAAGGLLLRRATSAGAAAECGPVRTHDVVDGPVLGTDMVDYPPSELYDDRPATSGRYLPSVASSGVYDVRIDERLLVHNLRDGYVVVHYDPAAPAGQVDALKVFAREQVYGADAPDRPTDDVRPYWNEQTDGTYPGMVVVPAAAPLPDDATVALVAWGRRQLCDGFSPDALLAFLDAHHGDASQAPGAFQLHTGGRSDGAPHGVYRPEFAEPVLLAPYEGASEVP